MKALEVSATFYYVTLEKFFSFQRVKIILEQSLKQQLNATVSQTE